MISGIRSTVRVALLAGIAASGGCASAVGEESADEGSLLVLVVVDQMRADHLERYSTAFSGGFARLRAEGYRFQNAAFDHAGTSTAPGHATAATGVHPYRHGLVGNSWDEHDGESGWESVYALRDLASPIVGEPAMEGRGPVNMEREGIVDWIRAHDPEARIVSVSGKDRAAIAMAGHVRGEVYWMDPELGRFVTSTYYRANYPEWVSRFNAATIAASAADTLWVSEVPAWAAALSRPDTSAYEADGVNTYFPHRASVEAGGTDARSLNLWRSRAPFPDQATIDFAREAVLELDLGQRGSLDYLGLALSQVDRIGHNHGPFSRESLDNLIRLDRELGLFMEFLDETVGVGRWTLGLTADHGALELAETRADLGLHGERIPATVRASMVERAEAAAARETDPVRAAQAAIEVALAEEWVADAFVLGELRVEDPDTMRALFARSNHPTRRTGPLHHLDVGVRMIEGAYAGGSTGSGHGSPYVYDRHVPFIVLAPGVPAGASTERVSIVDMAPTLAGLLGVPVPNDLDGRAVIRR